MEANMKMASEAAGTAPEARDVTPDKLTMPDNRKPSGGARPSLRTAIDAMCRECIYDPGSGNGGWREQVRACSSSNCPLHPVRPSPVRAIKTGQEPRRVSRGALAAGAVELALPSGKVGCNDRTTDERRAA